MSNQDMAEGRTIDVVVLPDGRFGYEVNLTPKAIALFTELGKAMERAEAQCDGDALLAIVLLMIRYAQMQKRLVAPDDEECNVRDILESMGRVAAQLLPMVDDVL